MFIFKKYDQMIIFNNKNSDIKRYKNKLEYAKIVFVKEGVKSFPGILEKTTMDEMYFSE